MDSGTVERLTGVFEEARIPGVAVAGRPGAVSTSGAGTAAVAVVLTSRDDVGGVEPTALALRRVVVAGGS